MADEVQATETVAPVTEQVTQSEPEQVTTDDVFDKERAMKLIEKLRAENKELKPKAKLAEELEAAEKQRKEAEMTELEKATNRIKELEGLTKAAELREMRRQVGAEFKLPDAVAELLPGDDIETMKSKAAELAKAIPAQKPTPTLTPTNPDGNTPETEAQKRERLLGSYHDIFKGGGINYPEQT